MVLLPCSRVLFESFRCSLKKNLCNTRVYVYDDDDDDAIILARVTLRVRIANRIGRGQLLSRRYCTHSGWLFSCASHTASYGPKALWRFRVSTSNSPSGRTWPHATRNSLIFIILTLDKIFEYVEMTICSRPSGSILNPKALSLLRVSI